MTFSSIILLFGIAIFISMCFVAAYNDFKFFKLPNKLILIIIILFFPIGLISYGLETVLFHVLTASVVLAISFVMFAFKLFGAGDAKFLTAVALWAGPSQIVLLLLVMGVLGGLLALLHTAKVRYSFMYVFGLMKNKKLEDLAERSEIPYGIAISAGAIVVSILQIQIHLNDLNLSIGG